MGRFAVESRLEGLAFERADPATFELAYNAVEIQRARHAEAEQRGFDAIHDGGKFCPGAHSAWPFTASTRPSVS